jgi:hypothetical protein
MSSTNYGPADFTRPRLWRKKHGGDTFQTDGSLDWFIRQHKSELVDSGELIVRRGPGGTLLGPNFGRVAVKILQRETSGRQGCAA